MSDSPATTEQSLKVAAELAARRLFVALAGGVLVVDAFVLERVVADDGMSSLLCALVGVIVLLCPLIRIVIDDIKRGQVRMNELAVLAVVAGASQGDLKTSGVIAFIMLISLIIESRTASGAKASLEALAKLSPGKARRVTESGSEELIDPSELQEGDRIQVRPGESILADGEILSGRTSIREANITGESLPVDRETGARVFAGTTNLTGAIDVHVSRAGQDTTLGKIRELILKAETTKLPVVRIIDQYVHYYTPVVLLLAVLVWLFTNDLGRIVALFVAACPVALVLATPSAMVAALSAAARVGLLVKNVSDFEAVARVTAFVFDKTGTLTSGRLSVSRLAPAEGIESAELLRRAASAEQQSNHPVAVALCALATKAKVSLAVVTDLHEEAGRGIRAVVEEEEVLVGNWQWMLSNGGEEESFPDWGDDETAGMSLLFVMSAGRALGWVGLEDQPRENAGASIEALRGLRVASVALITGDREGVAKRVAGGLGISDWRAECVPSEKVDYVEEAIAAGHRVAFVGDGVNDGPALAASHVGIALGAAGSDVAIESAAVALMNNDLSRLPFLVKLSRTARRVVLQNLVVGGVIVTGGVTLSALGVLGHRAPIVAACMQICGALAVVLNSARLIREAGDKREESCPNQNAIS